MLTQTRKSVLTKKLNTSLLHPNILIRSEFIHPHVNPNLFDFLSSVERKASHFEKFCLLFVNTVKVYGDQNSLVTNILQNIFL